MSQAKEILQAFFEHFATTANVRQVFGDAIETQGKTIVPVARVMYYMGAGSGGRKVEAPDGGHSGGGGGGAVVAWPVGVLEVTPERIHFERFSRVRRAGLLVGAGFLLGLATRALRRPRR
jgi:uncharacterized spore protein YtfJ